MLGVVFFAGLLLLQAERASGPACPTRHVGAYVFLLSVPGVAFAAYLAIASWAVLHVVCLLCVTIDVATLGVCVIGALMTRFPFASLPGRARPRPEGAAGAARGPRASAPCFAAAAVALVALFPRAAAEPVLAAGGETPEFVAPPPAAEAAAAAVAARPLHGQRPAADDSGRRRRARRRGRQVQRLPVPAMRQTFDAYKPLKAKWDKEAPGKVRFVTKDFPLEAECNANIKRRHASDRLRGGRRRPHGAREREGRRARGLDLRQPADPDARRPEEGGP